MILTLTPLRHDTELTLIRQDQCLIVNGTRLDFSGLAEGEERPAAEWGSDWLLGAVTRRAGQLHLHLALPHGANPPPETRTPAPIEVTADGPVPLPAFDSPPAPPMDEEVPSDTAEDAPPAAVSG
jgi:hypothetical protein